MDKSCTIVVENTQSKYFVDEEKLVSISQSICNMLCVEEFELGVQIVGAEKIKELNATYRGKDSETDVLSFPQMEWDVPLVCKEVNKKLESDAEGPPRTLGDIVLCLDVADLNAKEINQGLDQETCFLIVHGILHLCGHDHIKPEEERTMLEQQKMIIKKLSELSSEPIWTDCTKRIGEN